MTLIEMRRIVHQLRALAKAKKRDRGVPYQEGGKWWVIDEGAKRRRPYTPAGGAAKVAPEKPKSSSKYAILLGRMEEEREVKDGYYTGAKTMKSRHVTYLHAGDDEDVEKAKEEHDGRWRVFVVPHNHDTEEAQHAHTQRAHQQLSVALQHEHDMANGGSEWARVLQKDADQEAAQEHHRRGRGRAKRTKKEEADRAALIAERIMQESLSRQAASDDHRVAHNEAAHFYGRAAAERNPERQRELVRQAEHARRKTPSGGAEKLRLPREVKPQ